MPDVIARQEGSGSPAGTLFAAPPLVPVMSPSSPFDARRALLGAAKRLIDPDEAAPDPRDLPPRLTATALHALRMSRSRDKILANLDEMYREAFDRARTTGDTQQMASLDFAYRREQLYFEILLVCSLAWEKTIAVVNLFIVDAIRWNRG